MWSHGQTVNQVVLFTEIKIINNSWLLSAFSVHGMCPYYAYFKTKVKIIHVTEASGVTLRRAMKAGWEVTSRCQLSDRKQIRTANTIHAKMLSISPGKNFEKKLLQRIF